MMHYLLYVALAAGAAFFTGLLFYTFYIVLTSKSKPQDQKSAARTDKTGGKPAQPAASQSPMKTPPAAKPKKPGGPKKPGRRRAA